MGVPEKFLSIAEKLRELGATNVEIAYVWDRTAREGKELTDSKVHEALKEINPELAERFYREMQIKVLRTDMRKEHFNRKRIVDSLIREAKISRGLAEKIAREVEDKIRSTDVSVITSPLIRELVLARLIEMGLTEEYSRYMRLGIPVYDLEKAMERGNVEETVMEKIMSQYVIFEVLPEDAVEALLEGAWEIKGMNYPHKAFARSFVMRTPRKASWLSNFFKYITERDYVDTPSVQIPTNLEGDGTIDDIINTMGDRVIFWSENGYMGSIRSKIPVYSFGRVDAKIVSDVFVVDARRIAENTKSITGIRKRVETIAEGIDAYKAFKEKYVKKGEFITYVKNLEEAAAEVMVDTEKLKEIFGELKPFETA